MVDNISRSRARLDTWFPHDPEDQAHGSMRKISLATDRDGAVYFVRPFPKGVTIVDAKLIFYVRTGTAAVQVFRILESWIETGQGRLMYERTPELDTTAQVGSASPTGTSLEIDVTADMQDVSDGEPYHGYYLTASGTIELGSAEAKHWERRPLLEVTWSITRDGPAALSPVMGAAVPSSQPRVSWIFEGQVAYHALLSDDPTVDEHGMLVNPTYDTGRVDSANQGVRLETRIREGKKMFWQVQLEHETGFITTWSRPEPFFFAKRHSLKITEPSGSIATRPVVVKHETEADQKIVQYIVKKDGRVIFDSGKLATRKKTYELPIQALTGLGKYSILVRAWDGVRRAKIPGESAFLEAKKDFELKMPKRAAQREPTELRVLANRKRGGVIVEWDHEEDVETFALKVNGVYVDWIDPDEARVRDGVYRYDIYQLQPNRPYDVEIEPMVRSGAALMPMAGPFSHGLVSLVANAHLTHPTIGNVVILQQDGVQTTLGEDGVTFSVPGRRDPVRITSVVRGYEGSVSGGLFDYGGVTAAQYRDRMEDIKWDMNASALQLQWRDMNIQVAIEEVSINPRRAGWYDVEFGFFQIGNYSFGT